MPFKQFDRSRLLIKPLSDRIHDIDEATVNIPVGSLISLSDNPDYDNLANRIRLAREQEATVLLMYGAHVIRKGNSLYMIELMKHGLVTHLATNGAGSIHDFEFAMIGKTCESVVHTSY